jgi:hypothetical protein
LFVPDVRGLRDDLLGRDDGVGERLRQHFPAP